MSWSQGKCGLPGVKQSPGVTGATGRRMFVIKPSPCHAQVHLDSASPRRFTKNPIWVVMLAPRLPVGIRSVTAALTGCQVKWLSTARKVLGKQSWVELRQEQFRNPL